MKEKVATALDKVRPFLQRDGGDVELIDVTEDGLVKVRLQGLQRLPGRYNNPQAGYRAFT